MDTPFSEFKSFFLDWWLVVPGPLYRGVRSQLTQTKTAFLMFAGACSVAVRSRVKRRGLPERGLIAAADP